MHHLWLGVDAKLEHAYFHFEKPFDALVPSSLSAEMVAVQSSGGIIGNDWQRRFFAHFDAFLSATKSVPEIIRCCFEKDVSNKEMKAWFKSRRIDAVQKKTTTCMYRQEKPLSLTRCRHGGRGRAVNSHKGKMHDLETRKEMRATLALGLILIIARAHACEVSDPTNSRAECRTPFRATIYDACMRRFWRNFDRYYVSSVWPYFTTTFDWPPLALAQEACVNEAMGIMPR